MPISLGNIELSAIGDYAKVSLGADLIWSSEPPEEPPVEPVYLTNVIAYNQTTWAGWNKGTGVTADATGMSVPFPHSGYITSKYGFVFKANTKYGLLYNIVTNSIPSESLFCAFGGYTMTYFINSNGMIGNQKHVFTTGSSPTDSIFMAQNTDVPSGAVKFKDLRIFELTGQVDTDFINATTQTQIDTLCTKYPFVSL